MSLWILISGIFAPALFWAGYFYYKDRMQPEPAKLIGGAYLLGLAAGWACLKFYFLLDFIPVFAERDGLNPAFSLDILFRQIFIVGLIEEFFKFLPFILVFWQVRSFDEKTDGIIYSSMIALGFASFENSGYLPAMEGFELFGRAFASPLTHAAFSSVWGYFATRARFHGHPVWLHSLAGLMLAAVCHGLFNVFSMTPSLRILSSLLIMTIWIALIRILEKEESSPNYSSPKQIGKKRRDD